MKENLNLKDAFILTLEIGQYFMGYKNPEKVYDYEQKIKTSEWTVSLQCKNPSYNPFISQFIHSVEFQVPK